jgi:hypothetical protein
MNVIYETLEFLKEIPPSHRNAKINSAILALNNAIEIIQMNEAKIEALLAVIYKLTGLEFSQPPEE